MLFLRVLLSSDQVLSTRTPTCVPTRVCTQPCTRGCTQGSRGCPTSDSLVSYSAPWLFLPVLHLTAHQVFNCLFTRCSLLVRCNISLIREQKVAQSSFGELGSGKCLRLALFPKLPPQPALTPGQIFGTGTPGWVQVTQHQPGA